jgi:hypothetical protein
MTGEEGPSHPVEYSHILLRDPGGDDGSPRFG